MKLQKKTPEAWAETALRDPETLLLDHLQCEMKAASTSLSLISKNPKHPNLVKPLMEVAEEELSHYRLIHDFVVRRNYRFQPIKPSPYMVTVLKNASIGPHRPFLDRLLIASLVEARSCERFRLLERESEDPELGELFGDLVGSEARHFNLYVELAKTHFPSRDVDQRFQALSEIESEVLDELDPGPALHSGWKGLPDT